MIEDLNEVKKWLSEFPGGTLVRDVTELGGRMSLDIDKGSDLVKVVVKTNRSKAILFQEEMKLSEVLDATTNKAKKVCSKIEAFRRSMLKPCEISELDKAQDKLLKTIKRLKYLLEQQGPQYRNKHYVRNASHSDMLNIEEAHQIAPTIDGDDYAFGKFPSYIQKPNAKTRPILNYLGVFLDSEWFIYGISKHKLVPAYAYKLNETSEVQVLEKIQQYLATQIDLLATFTDNATLELF